MVTPLTVIRLAVNERGSILGTSNLNQALEFRKERKSLQIELSKVDQTLLVLKLHM